MPAQARTPLVSPARRARGRAGRRPAVSLGVAATLGGVVLPAATAPAATADSTYQVRPGDTLSHIASRTGTTTSALAAANGIRDPGRIRSGRTLVVPTSTRAATAPATYTVRPGDTLSAIAARTGTTASALAATNALRDANRIRPGQELRVPAAGAPSAPPATAASSSHTVAAGETVSHVAARAGVPVVSVLRANGLTSRSVIRPGQVLRVPTSGTADGAAPAPAAPSSPVPNSFAGRTYAAPVSTAAAVNRDTLSSRDVPSREQMRRIVADTARAMGVDPALAVAVAYQESGFNMRVVSPANAVGAMQVVPSSGRWASSLVGRELDLLDPRDNAVAGVAILRSLLRSTDDTATAVAGYYQGLAGVRRNGMYPDTRRYVANVQTLAARFS